jgi:hypothetical protein
MEEKMTELPIMDLTIVNAIKQLMDNIKNDIDPGNSMDDIADFVHNHNLANQDVYKPLLQSICDLLREKKYLVTSDFFLNRWGLKSEPK